MATTKQKQIFEKSTSSGMKTPAGDLIAIGTVVDSNDPMQWGRLRVVVPSWGDSWNHEVESMPWAMYVSPFGGQVAVGTTGPGVESEREGGVAYGMWAIPKIGAQVVVMSLDEDHQQRLYIGCVYDAFGTHTIPHGRWIADDHPELDNNKTASAPYGPYDSSEHLIQPLAQNQQIAFTAFVGNHEWKTRAADYAASRVDVSQLQYTSSKVQDDIAFESDGWEYTQGYQHSRLDPDAAAPLTGKVYDSQVYSITTPGFHSFSMDDKMENCRVRLRTTSGHQILMDDTNERIYISTAHGNNWVEMDQDGNVDVFSNSKVSIRAAKDINLTSDQSIRMYAAEGVHISSGKEIRAHAEADIHIDTKSKMHIKSGGDMNIKTGSNLMLTSSSTSNINAGGNLLMTAPKIHNNGPSAKKADEPALAFFPNKIPAHEPYARCMTKSDTSILPEFQYDDPNVGRMERGRVINRGLFWRR